MLQTAHQIKRIEGASDSSQSMVEADTLSRAGPWVASNSNRFAALADHQKDYSGEVSTADASVADVCSVTGPPCSDGSCKDCLTRESYESSNERSFSSSVSGYESDLSATTSDKENARLVGDLTPSRLPRAAAGDKTPRQADFGRRPMKSLNERAAKYFRGSEASDTTATTAGGMSEDEKYAAGIV